MTEQNKELNKEQNKEQNDTPKEITLDFPIKFKGLDIKTLTLRRAKVKDQLRASKLNKSAEEKEMFVFANLCDVEPDCIGELDMADYQKLQDGYSDFLQSPQKQSEA
jgi:hypothetical protein